MNHAANTAQMPGEVLSPSQAATFVGCSAKYRFKYVLNLPDPSAGGAVRGKAVHLAVEYYMRAKMAGVTLDVEAILAEWDQIWEAAAEGAEFAFKENVEALKVSGAALARKYLREAAPDIQPLAVEVKVSGAISGVPVRGIVDILDTDRRIIDIKTTARRSAKLSGDHAFQMATYAALLGPEASGDTRIDSLVATKDPQLVQIEHTPGARGQRLVETMYPLIVEGIAGGLFLPNRSSILCGYCVYREVCEAEYGGTFE